MTDDGTRVRVTVDYRPNPDDQAQVIRPEGVPPFVAIRLTHQADLWINTHQDAAALIDLIQSARLLLLQERKTLE